MGNTAFYAGAFMDKIPLLLVGTAGTSLDAPEVTRDRTEWVEGGFVTTKYKVRQPGMHDLYRRNFNGVDLFNRDCFGEHSIQMAVKTRSWTRRFFLAMLGMCETNALKAYRQTVGPITRYAWLCKLADALINNPFLPEEGTAAAEALGAGEGPSINREVCGNLEYTNHQAKCAYCGQGTHWQCACGYTVCRAGNSVLPSKGKGKRPPRENCVGWFTHLEEYFTGARATSGSESED